MKAISLHQPWASWVAEGWKTVETRTHQRFAGLHGKRIGIHAARKWDIHWLTLARAWLTDQEVYYTMAHQQGWKELGGHIIATAFVEKFVALFDPGNGVWDRALIDCRSVRRCGLFLKDVRKLTPLSWPGRQGIFNVPDDILGGSDETE